jgi:hypothetical protein
LRSKSAILAAFPIRLEINALSNLFLKHALEQSQFEILKVRCYDAQTPAMIPSFPPKFADLSTQYVGFRAEFEMRRASFPQLLAEYLRQVSLVDLQNELAKNDALAVEIKNQLKQRHFYKSATCFYRSFDLFLAYLSLQKRMFGTWAEVTGYYSRFYFVQGFLNLLQANWFSHEERVPAPGLINPKDSSFFIYNTGTQILLLSERDLYRTLAAGSKRGSHQIWWEIYSNLGNLGDYPQFESLQFVLSDGYFNPRRRNEVNYSHEYVRAFPELEWFDAATGSMLAQFQCQSHRADRDITDINRFFADMNDEDCDPGDFYGDDAQMLWCSIDCYLRLLSSLKINQDFVTAEKIEALADAHFGDEFPILRRGISIAMREALQF